MSATATRTSRPNTYAGTCRNCGGHVAAQSGLLGSKVNGRWTVEHTTCPEATTQQAPARRTARRNRPTLDHCYYGHTAPVGGCSSCFDDFS